jgi:hypothetical protein
VTPFNINLCAENNSAFFYTGLVILRAIVLNQMKGRLAEVNQINKLAHATPFPSIILMFEIFGALTFMNTGNVFRILKGQSS